MTQLHSAIKRIEDPNISQGVGECLRKIEEDMRNKNLRVTGITEDINAHHVGKELGVAFCPTNIANIEVFTDPTIVLN